MIRRPSLLLLGGSIAVAGCAGDDSDEPTVEDSETETDTEPSGSTDTAPTLFACPQQVVAGEGTFLGTLSDDLPSVLEPSCGQTGASGPEVTWELTVVEAGAYRLTTAGTPFDAVLTLNERCDGGELACNDDSEDPRIPGTQSVLIADLGANTPYIVALEAKDGTVDIGTGAVELQVTRVGPPEIEAYAVDRPRLDAPYRTTLTASDGVPPIRWSILDGELPDGLSLDPTTGEISGTPTSGLPASVLVQVIDATGTTRTARITFHDEPRWAGVGIQFGEGSPYELGLNNIEGGVVSNLTIVSPTPTEGGSLGAAASPSDADVSFAPSGNRVAFRGDFDTDGVVELWWSDLTGTVPGPAQKANHELAAEDVSDFSWSRDGRYLVYLTDTEADSRSGLFLVDTLASTPTPTRIEDPTRADDEAAAFAQFSPDGARLACLLGTAAGVFDLYVLDLTVGFPPVIVSGDLGLSAPNGQVVSWSPDSRSLLFLRGYTLFIADAAGSPPASPVRITSGPFRIADGTAFGGTAFGFSPDSSRIRFVGQKPVVPYETALFVADVANASSARQVSQMPAKAERFEMAAFTPDSRSIVFVADDAVLDFQLYQSDATGTASGGPVQISGPFSGGDVRSDVVVDPLGRGVYYRAARTNMGQVGLYFVGFWSLGGRLVSTNLGHYGNVGDYHVAQNGSMVLYEVDRTMFAVDMAQSPGSPMLVNPSLGDGLIRDHFVVGDGEAVIYSVQPRFGGNAFEVLYTQLVGASPGAQDVLTAVPPVEGTNVGLIVREN